MCRCCGAQAALGELQLVFRIEGPREANLLSQNKLNFTTIRGLSRGYMECLSRSYEASETES